LALAALVLSAMVMIAYGNSISNGFVWDDHEQVVMNPALKPDAPLSSLFTADVRFARQSPSVQTADYRPLQMLTYRTVAALSGFSPAAFHATSVLFAMGGALAAFAMFWLLTRKMALAFVAAALFAVHPVHTEAVDWIAALPDLGCGLFFLLAFALFLAGRETRAGSTAPKPPMISSTISRWLLPLFSLLAFAFALLWKETAAVLPIVVVVYVLVVEKGGSRVRAALLASAPFWGVLALYLGLRVRVLGSAAAGMRDWALTPIQLLLTPLHLMLAYWWKLAVPLRLNAYYVFSPVHSITDPRAIAAIVLTLCGIAGAIYLAGRAPLACFAGLWVCITLLPAMDVYALGRNVFAERYLYLPSAGFCLLATLFAAWLLRLLPAKFRRPAGWTLFVVVASVFAAETIGRNPVWKDDAILFPETLRLSPDAPFVRFMVANTQSSNSSESAEQNYLRAISLAKEASPPDRVDLLLAYHGAASLYADRGDYPRALAMLAQAREAVPADVEGEDEEGLILARAGRWSEAEPLLAKLLAKQPKNENVLSTIGLMEWQYHHDRNRAAELFTRALAIHSQGDDFSASLHNNLGSVDAELGNFPAAIEQFRLAVGIAPGDPEYHTNLANALGAAGRYDEARSEAEAALRIDPGFAAARAVLEHLGAGNN
jgi:tetratricopeptide (TPR) repeat protein